MALVFEVILDSICETSIFQVCGQQSTTTGTAPARTMAAAQEIMVKLGKITSSPTPICKAATATSSAADPLLTAIPYWRPTFMANSSSNRLTNGPSEEIHPVSIHSIRYCLSVPSRQGSLTGIGSTLLLLHPPFFSVSKASFRSSRISWSSSEE